MVFHYYFKISCICKQALQQFLLSLFYSSPSFVDYYFTFSLVGFLVLLFPLLLCFKHEFCNSISFKFLSDLIMEREVLRMQNEFGENKIELNEISRHKHLDKSCDFCDSFWFRFCLDLIVESGILRIQNKLVQKTTKLNEVPRQRRPKKFRKFCNSSYWRFWFCN